MKTPKPSIGNPKSRLQTLYWFMGLTIATLFIGCRMARMAIPEPLMTEAVEMTVEGRQKFTFKESLTFGPYRVTDVDRSWTKTSSWGGQWFSNSKAKQSYEFTLRDSNTPIWEAQCATGVDERELNFNNFLGGQLEITSASIYFACAFLEKQERKRWRLVMSQSPSEMVMDGVLTDGQTRINVKGSQKLQGSPIPLSDPTGYEFELRGHIVGAVEVINKGSVWLHPSIEPEIRSALATASSALLLYRAIHEK